MTNHPARTGGRRAPGGPLLPLFTVVVLSLALAQRSYAQQQVGRVVGVVYDSVHARPARGARVVAVGRASRSEKPREATSDSTGRYLIDSLPLGRYIVGFESALLDSLEITLPPREATIAPGSDATVDLAIPSAAKLRAAVCPGVTLYKDQGVLYGDVVNAETESPLAGVVVALQWRELTVWDSTHRKALPAVATPRMASVTTDDRGWYHACGVPAGNWVSLQVQHEGHIGPTLRTLVDDTLGIGIRHISFSPSTAHVSKDFADSTHITPFVGTATLTGFVRGTTGTPISSAQVHVLGARSTAVTDAEGGYTLSDLPAGTHELEARRLGYSIENTWVELRSGVTTRSDVRLRPLVSLDSIRVVATRTRYKEFAQHQSLRLGGRFLGPADLLRLRVSRTSDLLASMPGFIVESRGGRSRVYSYARGQTCLVNVAIDGFQGWSEDPEAFSVDDVQPSEVGAIETYPAGSVGVSPELDHGCGAIVIWTKR